MNGVEGIILGFVDTSFSERDLNFFWPQARNSSINLFFSGEVYMGEKMIKQLENQIRDLQKELAGVQKDQAVLRLQPCRGDSEIRKKDEKLDELDRRAKIINENIRDLTRKLQLLISESNKGASCNSPNSNKSS